MVAAWVEHDAAHPIGVGANSVSTYVVGAYSLDGGVTWTSLPGFVNFGGVNNQTDISASQSNGRIDFTQTTDPTVAFGRDESAYLLTSEPQRRQHRRYPRSPAVRLPGGNGRRQRRSQSDADEQAGV